MAPVVLLQKSTNLNVQASIFVWINKSSRLWTNKYFFILKRVEKGEDTGILSEEPKIKKVLGIEGINLNFGMEERVVNIF